MRTRLLFATVLVAFIAASAWFATQAPSSGALDRTAVVERARSWTDEGVPYSQTDHKDGYRQDCSGFVSMAWNLPENLTTWRIPLVVREISKDELEPGDVLLDHTSDDRHVVIFEKWANAEKTEYWALESSGHPDIKKAVRRIVPYPYVLNENHYRPYRFVGMDGYWENVSEAYRQPVEGYDSEEVGRDS